MSKEPSARILVADDEPLYLRTTTALLAKAGYECVGVADGAAAIEAVANSQFDLVLSDLNMPGNRDLELLRTHRERQPEIPLIVVTGAPSLPTAIESLRLGIADYLLKPVKFQDLRQSIEKVLAQSRPRVPARTDAEGEEQTAALFPEIVGESTAVTELKQLLDKVAQSDANVLITGESGTGKEVIARALHQHGRRAGHGFQVVDCTAIPESLFESVLFGHVKGSFTGAVKDQDGLLSQADGGTVFFDEIGELPLAQQSKLLRLIQEQTFTPVGKATPVHVDTRFPCATNRDLELEVNAGRFRRDLFYRLAVLHLELPPLRERESDVLLLARHFLKQLQPNGMRVQDFSAAALQKLLSYSWPGNIRELRNAVERGIALATTDQIEVDDLPKAVISASAAGPLSTQAGAAPLEKLSLQEAELAYLKSILADNLGNVSRAAEQAGMTRQGLHKRLKKAGLDANDYRK